MNRPTGGGGGGGGPTIRTSGGASNRPPSSSSSTPRTAGVSERAANLARAQAFLRGLVSEMRRVTWPSREEWIAATVLTVALVVGIGLYTFVVDEALTGLFGLVHH
jgi:preprotein translocase SecE subunit